MKDNFLQLTTCHSGLVYCRLVVSKYFGGNRKVKTMSHANFEHRQKRNPQRKFPKENCLVLGNKKNHSISECLNSKFIDK